MKAAAKLSETEKCIAGGQAYNISDNCPMEPYQFIKPLFDAMEQPLPWIPLPFFLVYIAAYILEILHYAVGVYPIFTRNEIVKVTNSHYCKMDKAINELGYSPKTYKVSFHISNKKNREFREIVFSKYHYFRRIKIFGFKNDYFSSPMQLQFWWKNEHENVLGEKSLLKINIEYGSH